MKTTTEQWLTMPDKSGWWLWRECGRGEPESVLVRAGNDLAAVVYDDEWEAAMGRPPNEFYCENYWEGTDCDQDIMPGLWKFDRPEPTLKA